MVALPNAGNQIPPQHPKSGKSTLEIGGLQRDGAASLAPGCSPPIRYDRGAARQRPCAALGPFAVGARAAFMPGAATLTELIFEHALARGLLAGGDKDCSSAAHVASQTVQGR